MTRNAPNTAPQPGRATSVKSADKAERILDAAEEELSTTSGDRITMAAIARRAGVPVGALYQHFENKNVLLVALAGRMSTKADADTADVLRRSYALAWRDAVDATLEETHGFLRDNETFRQLILSIRFTREYKNSTMAVIFRGAELMMLHPAVARAGIDEERARQICRTALAAAFATEELVLDSGPDDINDWIAEAKTMIEGYLGTYLD